MLKYYNKYEGKNGVIYSIDMIRLNLKFTPDSINEFMDYLNKINLTLWNTELKYYNSVRQYTFRHLFNFKTENCSFVIALQFNSSERAEMYKGYIEFNPNKCRKDYVFEDIYRMIRSLVLYTQVKRYDLAIDIPVHISNCFLLKDKRKYQFYKNDTITHYLGSRSCHGFVKLYEKDTVEKLDYNLTRLELTVEFGEDLQTILPVLYVRNFQMNLQLENNLSQNDRVLCDLLVQSENMTYFLGNLTYRKRVKLLPYLDCYKFEYDKKGFDCIRQELKEYMIGKMSI